MTKKLKKSRGRSLWRGKEGRLKIASMSEVGAVRHRCLSKTNVGIYVPDRIKKVGEE
ncbi:hypothetical protein Ancab_039315, partial [Ancistrocladus abbreviatus]